MTAQPNSFAVAAQCVAIERDIREHLIAFEFAPITVKSFAYKHDVSESLVVVVIEKLIKFNLARWVKRKTGVEAEAVNKGKGPNWPAIHSIVDIERSRTKIKVSGK